MNVYANSTTTGTPVTKIILISMRKTHKRNRCFLLNQTMIFKNFISKNRVKKVQLA